MKDKTQKLLVWLYQPALLAEKRLVGYDQLELLFPNYTPGGRRSLVYYLQQKHLLKTERQGRKSGFSLTTHGQEAVEELFPALSPRFRGEVAASGQPATGSSRGSRKQSWQGQWQAVIFIDAPKGDQHFRYLREQLVAIQAVSLSRGVYLHPGPLPASLQAELRSLYVGAVQVLSIDQWQFGDEQATVEEHYNLSDVVEILSGLSSEIEELLTSKKEQNSLTNKNKQQVFSVFDRLFEVLKNDAGLSSYYYPQTLTAFELLMTLQTILD